MHPMTLSQLVAMFRQKGCSCVLAKTLASNDNSKNQVYFGPDFQVLNLFPNLTIAPDNTGTHGPVFKAPINLAWVDAQGREYLAPHAQIILYPQYPEVRFSGFLRGCGHAPSALMTERSSGRILLLGIAQDGRVLGFVAAPDDALACEFNGGKGLTQYGVFFDVPMQALAADHRTTLLAELRRIHHLQWISSKRLSGKGQAMPYKAQNGGGLTLEAELGITPNSFSGPDYLGWEVKQHNVSQFNRPAVGVLTLMTPEPTGGFYKDHGASQFVRTFGYCDQNGKQDRLNFGGIHLVGNAQHLTGLQLHLTGYDVDQERIVSGDGAIVLTNSAGMIAASWSFAGLMTHWNRKHNRAVYIPSRVRSTNDVRQYWYGNLVRLGEGTDFLLFLKAMAQGVIYYDPAIKVEQASSANPTIKKRSQFRIRSGMLGRLYTTFETVDVLADGLAGGVAQAY